MKSAFRFIPVFIFLAFSGSLIFSQTADYFPLQIGNKWLYNWERHNGTITREIIDTLSINNNLYYLMFEEQNSSFWGKDTLFNFYRQDSVNRIWVAHPYTLKETLTTVQFNRAPGLIDSTYDPINNLTRVTTLQDTNFTVNTPAGTFYHCYYFNSLLVEIYTDFINIYAPNIGLVRVLSEGEQYILRGALVNNISYGDTTRTPVDKANESIVPANFVLDQNYPNPFNKSTIISYYLNNPAPADVKVTIYNITGKEVKRLVDEKQPAGQHAVRWNGTNERGQPVSSGVYIYQLRLGELIAARKLLITK